MLNIIINAKIQLQLKGKDMKPWLIFDVDDVLFDFTKSLYEAGQKHGKLRDSSMHHNQWTQYNHPIYLKYDDQESFRAFLVDAKVQETDYTCDGTQEFMAKIKDDFSLGFLTARGFNPNAEKITHEFLERAYGIKADKVVISGMYGDNKVSHLPKFSGAPVISYLDDNAQHVKEFQEAGIPSYLMSRNWNLKDTGVPRIQHINEMLHFIYA